MKIVLFSLCIVIVVAACSKTGDTFVSNSCSVNVQGHRYGATVETNLATNVSVTHFTPEPGKALDQPALVLPGVDIPEIPETPEGADMGSGDFSVEGDFCRNQGASTSSEITTVTTTTTGNLGYNDEAQ